MIQIQIKKQQTYGGYKECWNETVLGVGKGADIFNIEVSLTADTTTNHSNSYRLRNFEEGHEMNMVQQNTNEHNTNI